MGIKTSEPVALFGAVQRSVRKDAGKNLTPFLRRWKQTRSSDESRPKANLQTARFLTRLGVLDAGKSLGEQGKAYDAFLQGIERATGEAPGLIDAWLAAFSGGAYGVDAEGICGETPRCTACPLKENCRYLDSGAREERLSPEMFARELQVTGYSAGPKRSRRANKKAAAGDEAEVLGFLLSAGKGGAGAAARAEAMLQHFGGLRKLLEAGPEELKETDLGKEERAQLRAVARLCLLWGEERENRGKRFAHGGDFFEYFHLRLRSEKKEKLFVICLDQKHRILGEELVSEGSLTETLVHPREVFAPAIRMRAAAVAVVHNHPSGDPKPSPQDREMTDRLAEVADLVGIPLLDHVVIGDGKYTSFVDKGWL